MKNFLKLFIALLIIISIIPCLSLINFKNLKSDSVDSPTASVYNGDTEQAKAQGKVAKGTAHKEDIKLYLCKEKKVVTLSAEEYIIGCLAAETGNSDNLEALKAQAVACYTYAVYCKENNSRKALNGAYLSDDSKTYQAYKSTNTLKSELGNAYDEYMKNIISAAEQVAGQVITYDKKAILAAYHSCNAGHTESCEDIWGKKLPYLQSVLSTPDTLCPKYRNKVTIKSSQILSNLKKYYPTKKLNPHSDKIEILSATEHATVKEISAFGARFTGAQFRAALKLNSANFKLKKSGSKYTFTVFGYGHSVGMSQQGAEYMAAQGASYEEILKHYYSGVEIDYNYTV